MVVDCHGNYGGVRGRHSRHGSRAHRGDCPHVWRNRTLRCLNGEPSVFHREVRQPELSEPAVAGRGPIAAQSGSQIGGTVRALLLAKR